MKKLALLTVLTGSLLTAISQNIGIGITNPTRAKLEINGTPGNSSTVAIFGGESTGISIQRNWPSIGYNQYYNEGSKYIGNGYAAVQYLDPYNGGIYTDLFSTGTTNAACSPPKRVMSLLQSGAIAFHGTSHNSVFNSGTNENTYIRAGKSGGQVIINDIPDGEVILRNLVRVTGNSGGYFSVQGSFSISEATYGFEKWLMNVSPASGDLLVFASGLPVGSFNYSNGNYHSISDGRLKKNINELPPLLSKVMRLRPVEYDMKFGKVGVNKSIGFIAQDVRNLFPELVTVIKDEKSSPGIRDLHTMNYSVFGVLSIKAIQEQQIIIQSLLSRIEKLDAKVNVLEKRVY